MQQQKLPSNSDKKYSRNIPIEYRLHRNNQRFRQVGNRDGLSGFGWHQFRHQFGPRDKLMELGDGEEIFKMYFGRLWHFLLGEGKLVVHVAIPEVLR